MEPRLVAEDDFELAHAAQPASAPVAHAAYPAPPSSLTRPPPRDRSALGAAVLGWLVPGMGHAVAGRPGAGLVLLLAIGGLFAGGLALTSFTCVDPRTYELEFVAQALIGGPTALALRLTDGLVLTRMPPWFEAGRLYVVVAGILNFVAVLDAMGEVARRNARARAAHARRLAEARAAAEDSLSGLSRAGEPATAEGASA